MSDRWSVLEHKHKKKLALCGTPSFPEGNVMHGKYLTGFEHWTLKKLGVAQYTSYAIPDND